MEKSKRYQHIYTQFQELMLKSDDVDARMCSIAAVLHHKMDKFFWTGFYCLQHGKLIVKTYQGPVACMELRENTGVCWAGINSKNTIIVEDVEKFPGHIACDSRSKSEIVVPLFDKNSHVIGVLDVDSKELAAFDAVDAIWLEKIVALL